LATAHDLGTSRAKSPGILLGTTMTDPVTTSKRTTRLLMAAVILLCVVVALQIGLLLERRSAPESRPLAAVFPPVSKPTLFTRIRNWFSPPKPTNVVTPDTVWSQFGEMERMHDQINRMFEQTFRDVHSLPLAPAAASNATTSGGGAPSPFHHIDHMRRQIDAMFASAMSDFDSHAAGFEDGWSELALTPSLSVRDMGGAYEIAVQIPGVDKSNIRVSMDGSILDIAVAFDNTASGRTGNRSAWQSRQAGRFERRLKLPGATARHEDVKATYDGGVLRINVPKMAGTEAQGRIAVN
jgi:HSP20 family protein